MDTRKRLPIPAAFRETHYHHIDVCHILGCDEPTFWGWYASHKILPGVNLMPLVGQPFIVWPKSDLDAWIAADCPVDTEVLNRQRRVVAALVEAVEADGFDLGSAVREMVEGN